MQMENITPQTTPLATLCSHPAAHCGFKGPDWMDEDGQAVEQVGPSRSILGSLRTKRRKPRAPTPDLCFELD